MVYPNNSTVGEAASTCLDMLANSYQSCRLGRHTRGGGSEVYQDGLVPVQIPDSRPDIVFDNYRETCEELGLSRHAFVDQLLTQFLSGSQIPVQGTRPTNNVVIYMVDPFNDEALLPHYCAAFAVFVDSYALRAKRAGISYEAELILQIVPLDFLVKCDQITIPPPKAYSSLAFEVYNRCSAAARTSRSMPSPHASASAVQLAKPVPKAVDFRLNSQPPADLLADDPSLHLAYSWEPDEQWLSCAWTDNLGTLQWNAVYCLGYRRLDFYDAFSETVEEILDTTKDMLQPANLPWRLYIVKDGPLQQRELAVWQTQSNSEFYQRQVTTTILVVDSDPPLSLRPGRGPVQLPQLSAALPVTPLATSPQVMTPDQSSPAASHTPLRTAAQQPATPSATGFTENDPSARLIDVVSETWTMISPLPIQDPYISTPHLASITISGYLLKRAGPDERDGLLTLGVSLVSGDLSSSKSEAVAEKKHEKLLIEVLKMYSDLATLARLRGTEDRRTGVLPWHVAAARKGRDAVRLSMTWGEREESNIGS
ncbi:MAG: hypothetical protein Q9174_005482 [Haloplaca sp. 1 TL-2023]